MARLEFLKNQHSLKIPFAGAGVSAGFPSPADDFLENRLDISDLLIAHPEATFYARVNGTSMQDEGINDGDILIIDKSLQAKSGDIAVCYLDGEFTVKKIDIRNEEVRLVPANTQFPAIQVLPENNFIIWGIVTFVIKSF